MFRTYTRIGTALGHCCHRSWHAAISSHVHVHCATQWCFWYMTLIVIRSICWPANALLLLGRHGSPAKRWFVLVHDTDRVSYQDCHLNGGRHMACFRYTFFTACKHRLRVRARLPCVQTRSRPSVLAQHQRPVIEHPQASCTAARLFCLSIFLPFLMVSVIFCASWYAQPDPMEDYAITMALVVCGCHVSYAYAVPIEVFASGSSFALHVLHTG